jgi:Uma2 family endonuclease
MAGNEPGTKVPLTLGSDDEGRTLSAEEFAHATFLEPWRYERVDERLIVMAPDGADHVNAVSQWLKRLMQFWLRRPEIVDKVVPYAWLRINSRKDRIGDLGVYLAGSANALAIPERVPELMVEVVREGRANRDCDYIEKRADYHRVGVREYVVVDRFTETVTVFLHSPNEYVEHVFGVGETFQSGVLPGLAIPISEVFE